MAATRNGTRLGGEAYVELTGYAPVAPAAASAPAVDALSRATAGVRAWATPRERDAVGRRDGDDLRIDRREAARSRIIALADCLYAVVFVTDWTSASTAVSWMPL